MEGCPIPLFLRFSCMLSFSLKLSPKCCQAVQRKKLEGPKPNWSSICLLLLKNNKRCLFVSVFLSFFVYYYFYKCVRKKKRERELRRIIILYWMWENRIKRDDEKAEVFSAFFTSLFYSKTSCSPSTQPLSWQNEALIIHEEMVRELLFFFDVLKSR